MKVELYCAFCGDKIALDVSAAGWQARYGVVSDEAAFCPKHAQAEDFFKDQCPGCVSGWPDCPLHRAFAYSRNRHMNDGDFDSLCSGVCPKRVNGTFMVAEGRVEQVNLSKGAQSESGAAVAAAIRQHIEQYPDERP